MPGMNSGLNVDDPTVVAAFRSALLHQAIIALAIFAVLSVVWVSVRERHGAGAAGAERAARRPAEPAAHRVLRIGFGLLWLLDGLLQAQPGMAAGLPSQVIEPAAAGSPVWVQHLINWAGTSWSYHPIQAGAAAVWIQVGIGVWLLAAPRGISGRLAGLASMAWGLIVWVFGEAFGGILAPGLTWLAGAPGAALVYVVAGGLLALPDRSWRTPRLGRAVLAGLRAVPDRNGRAAGLAGAGFLAGQPERPAGLADQHDPVDDADLAAAVPVRPRIRIRIDRPQ